MIGRYEYLPVFLNRVETRAQALVYVRRNRKLYLRAIASNKQALQQFTQKKLRWARFMRTCIVGSGHSNWSSAMMMIWIHMEHDIQQCLPRPGDCSTLFEYTKKVEKSRIIVNAAVWQQGGKFQIDVPTPPKP
jgi:hypothetical protein